MSNRYSRKNNVSKTFKDYLVPIVGVVIVIILVISFMSGGDEQNIDDLENRVGMDVSLDEMQSEANIVYLGGKEKKVEGGKAKIYKGDKVIVNKGEVKLDLPGMAQMTLNELGELKFNEDGTFSLFASDLWVNASTDFTLNLTYAIVDIKKDTVLSVTQNENLSSIYVLKGIAEVENRAGKSTVLGKGQKIVILNKDANDDTVDLGLEKEEIDEFFKQGDWFVKNNGILFLTEDETESGSGITDNSGSIVDGNYISFDSLHDESYITSSIINVRGSIYGEEVTSISVNGINATINSEANTFEIKEFSVESKVNDLVYKVYNGSKEVLQKGVITLYNAGGTDNSSESGFQVESFPIDSSEFQFVSPSDNPYTTEENIVTIRGKVPSGKVSKITVNGFTLKQFTANGTDWRYHANVEFGNLKEGMNVYEVKYFDSSGKMIHSNTFFIKKVEEESSSTYTDEATVTG